MNSEVKERAKRIYQAGKRENAMKNTWLKKTLGNISLYTFWFLLPVLGPLVAADHISDKTSRPSVAFYFIFAAILIVQILVFRKLQII